MGPNFSKVLIILSLMCSLAWVLIPVHFWRVVGVIPKQGCWISKAALSGTDICWTCRLFSLISVRIAFKRWSHTKFAAQRCTSAVQFWVYFTSSCTSLFRLWLVYLSTQCTSVNGNNWKKQKKLRHVTWNIKVSFVHLCIRSLFNSECRLYI